MDDKHSTKCDGCGCRVALIYGGDDIGWTGVCNTCGSILQFVPNEEVNHE